MIFGLEHIGALYDTAVRDYVATSGVPMLVVDYRVAPEHPHPTPVEDCYAALVWLAENAGELGVDPARIAVMGDSAGGGLAAGVCLLARDRGGPAVAQQLLIYPMLDDRPATPDPQLLPFLTWTYDDNVTGWGALLGEGAGTDAVSPYAAPARADDLAGLPDTYIDVGDLDIFRDEDITYARRLADAGVPTELHVYPGCPHAFEALARRCRRVSAGDRRPHPPPAVALGLALDDGLDPLQRLAHVADVAALAQLASEHREQLHRERVVEPERLGDVGAAVSRRQPVMPVVDRLVAHQHGETEFTCRVRMPSPRMSSSTSARSRCA